MNFDESIQLARQELAAGRAAAADAIARRLIVERPGDCAGLNLLGDVQAAAGRLDLALLSYEKAVKLDPANMRPRNGAGDALMKFGKLEEAIAVYAKAFGINPDDAGILRGLGVAYRQARRIQAAITVLNRWAILQPDSAAARFELGILYEQSNRLEDAAEEFSRATEIDPRMGLAFSKLGGICTRLGRVDEAIAACKTASELEPNAPDAMLNMAMAWEQAARPELAADSHRRAAALSPAHAGMASNYLHSLYFHPEYSMRMLVAEHSDWDRVHGGRLRPLYYKHDNDRDPERVLKVAYLSPNFRSHPVAAFVLPLLLYHDHGRFEVHCYNDCADPDGVTSRMELCADGWHETSTRGPEAMLNRIRCDRIDILVDLSLHMPGNRMAALAAKPAPVQIAFPAYPGTSGLWSMDYRLTDPFLDPPDEHDDHFTEKTVRLPRTFACFDPAGMDERIGAFVEDLAIENADPGPPPALSNGYLTFGYFDSVRKINDDVLRRWSLAFKALPDSRLRLGVASNAGQRRVIETLDALGMKKDRIEFVGELSRSKRLQEYRAVDICLDTLPFCGQETTLDAIWMGTPVITQAGKTATGRMGWSFANNLGLADLAARNDDEFAQIAAGLGRDIFRLSELRRTLRTRLLQSPIMDAPAYTRDVEAAYRQMWKDWVKK